MEPSAPLVFRQFTPAQFARLIAKAQAAGIALSGNSGTASKFGLEVSWDYAPDKQKLTLQCLRTPSFVSADEVNAKLQALVKESLSDA
jgi:hypothetical protein